MSGTGLIAKDGFMRQLVQLADGTWAENVVAAAPSAAVANGFTTQVDGATVQENADSVVAATATGGKRWARVIVGCNKAHSVSFYGYTATFNAVASVYKLDEATKSGKAAISGYFGNAWVVDVAGLAFFAAVVHNDDVANDAVVTVKVAFFD